MAETTERNGREVQEHKHRRIWRGTCNVCHCPVNTTEGTEDTRWYNVGGRLVLLCEVHAPFRIPRVVAEYLKIGDNLPVGQAQLIGDYDSKLYSRVNTYCKSHNKQVRITTLHGKMYLMRLDDLHNMLETLDKQTTLDILKLIVLSGFCILSGGVHASA